MKIFANRSIWKKIVIIFSLIFSMSFVEPAPVKAGIGGTLMEPVCDLLVGLGDGFMNVTHHILAGQETTLIRVNLNEGWLDIFRVVVTVAAFVAVVAAAALITGGAAIAIGAVTGALASSGMAAIATSAIMANIVPIAILGTFFGVKAYSMDAFDNELDLPMYSISPERIFSNTIPFFDVNFFNPNSAPFKYEWVHKKTPLERTQERLEYDNKYTILANYTCSEADGGQYYDKKNEAENKFNLTSAEWDENLKNELQSEYNSAANAGSSNYITEFGSGIVNKARKAVKDGVTYIELEVSNGGNEYRFYQVNDSSSSDLAGKETPEGGGTGEKHSITYELANTVKFWYRIIRTLAIVGMMSVLVYIGIRILLSSTAEQKAKHKELLKDWLVGMVLLFTMQYIMVFANIAVDHLTDLLKNINPMGQTALIPDDKGKVEAELKEYNIGTTETEKDITINENNSLTEDSKVVFKKIESGHTYIEWNTDLMGQLRIALQAHKDDNEAYIGYTIMYIVMIIYTAIFCFTYIKRVIYMAFLTIISPLVALTYPIDKVNDGSAQGFNYWFKEYIFNLLLQPLHLLIYTILVSTAIKFAAENIIYSLVALGFITQAEKIVRQMFNFSKASTPGIFAGPAGAAMTMTGMRWLMGHGPRGAAGGGKASGGSGGGSASNNGGKLRTKDDKNSFKSSDNRSILIGSEGGLGGNTGGQGDSTSVFNRIGESVDGTSGNEPSSLSFLERMQEAELEDTPYIPNSEQLQMWDNDARYDENNNDGMNYSDDEYRQILSDSGYSDDQISQLMKSPLERMQEGELEATPYIPTNEQFQMWDNDTRFENNNDGMSYSDDEYRQILRESGYSDQDMAEIIGDASTTNLPQERQIPQEQQTQNNNQTQTTQGNEQQDEGRTQTATKEEGKSSIRRALGATASAYGEGMKEKIVDGLQNARPGKAIGRAIGGAIGAATFGTIGVAAGVASGDMKSVMTDGIAGVAGGYKLGTGAVNSANSALSVDGFGDEFSKKYYGEEGMARRNRREKASSKANVDKVMEKYDIKSRKEAEKKAVDLGDEYWKHDDKLEFDQIIKMDKARKDEELQFYDPKEGKTRGLKEKEIVQANNDINKYGIANMKGDKDRSETAKQFNLDHPELKLTAEQTLAYIDKLRMIYNKMND